MTVTSSARAVLAQMGNFAVLTGLTSCSMQVVAVGDHSPTFLCWCVAWGRSLRDLFGLKGWVKYLPGMHWANFFPRWCKGRLSAGQETLWKSIHPSSSQPLEQHRAFPTPRRPTEAQSSGDLTRARRRGHACKHKWSKGRAGWCA